MYLASLTSSSDIPHRGILQYASSCVNRHLAHTHTVTDSDTSPSISITVECYNRSHTSITLLLYCLAWSRTRSSLLAFRRHGPRHDTMRVTNDQEDGASAITRATTCAHSPRALSPRFTKLGLTHACGREKRARCLRQRGDNSSSYEYRCQQRSPAWRAAQA